MSDGATLIDPSGIPHFIGDLSTLDVDVMLLTANAAQFRASGADIHTTFQGLSAVYHAPEAGDLLSSTEPVRTKSDAFADDLEKVVSALSEYSAEVQPLVDRLETLKADATAFVASVSGDEDWRKDQDKVDRNNTLWREVNHAVAAFQAAERRAYNKIMGLIGGQRLTVDDGSHGDSMYGYRADDLDHARQTPWGAPAEREYEGWDWLRHEAGQVWEGIWTDGVIGTVHGVGTLFGSDGSHAAGEAWKNLAKLGTASALTSATFGTWWLVPEDQQPTWLRESREAHKGMVKGLVAWDTWQTNPARAAGAVTFNVLTILGTDGAGSAARTGAAARTLSVVGKVGRAIDPMTYAGKAGKFAFVKVGDAFSKLKDLRTGATYALPETPLTERPPAVPEHAAELVDDAGHRVYLDTRTGDVLNADGTIRQHAGEAAHEPSAHDRSTLQTGTQRAHAQDLVGSSARHDTPGTSPTAHHEPPGSGTGGIRDHGNGPGTPHDPASSHHETHTGTHETNHGAHQGDNGSGTSTNHSEGGHDAHGTDGASALDDLRVDENPLPQPGPGEKILGDLPESRVQRTSDGLISHVDGRPVTEFLDQLSHERALSYLDAKETGAFPRAQTGACVGSVVDLRTGRVVEGINGPKGPDGELSPDDLHPTLLERYKQIVHAPPHRAPILAHAEVKAANELLWARTRLGLPDDASALREMRASVQFPFMSNLETGVRPRPAPFCGNCNHMLDGVPSSHGRYLKDPPSAENWIP
ncbi:hypothetical protein ACH4UY_10995 [Streptomyces longwoodensis]|uniref:hypothetical protein n=1 Tax=Streptomyces longwoodensis TaxID=68231 RepID=UPI0037BBA281